jgi:hypothetical protein
MSANSGQIPKLGISWQTKCKRQKRWNNTKVVERMEEILALTALYCLFTLGFLQE